MPVSKADRVKLQLLEIHTWDAEDTPSRWAAWQGPGTSKGANPWVYYKDHTKKCPHYSFNFDTEKPGRVRIMAPTEEKLVKLILENLK